MQENVFVTIDGTKHARLIYYYMLLEQCEEKDSTLKVHEFSLESHYSIATNCICQ